MSGGALDLAVAGLGTGAVAALSGLGVLATYRVTGVLNVAFGAIGMVGAYLARALVLDARLPVYAAGLIVVCCFAPLLGLALQAAVFGPLSARAADAGRLLTAGFGVTVLLVGLATAIWGEQARTDAPSLLPGGTTHPAGVDLPAAVPIELFLVLLVALGLGWFSRGGPAVRAVIDDRRLAELAGLPARRLARIGWVAGTMLATLTGMLLAPQLRFDPSTLTLVLFETLGVAVAARLRSAPIAILAAFGTAIGQAELTAVHLSGAAGSVLDAVRSNLFVVLLLLATWATPAFGSATAAGRRRTRVERGWPPYALVLALGLAGWVLRPADLRSALAVPAFALVLLSFRVLDAGGMLSLGQAGLAGVGALAAGWAPGWGMLGAPFAGAAVAVVLALPVLRRAGLHLAVASLAAATALGSFLFDQPLFTPSSVPRPGFAQPDRGYLYFELAVMVLSLLAMTVLVRGRLALRLSALRDSETASRTAGIAVDRERLAVFACAGALAALGGALWAAGDQVFDPTAFEPAQGLLWFAAAAAVGFADSAALILAAMVLTLADTYVSGSSAILVGLATLVLPALRSGIGTGRGWKAAPRVAPDAVQSAMACDDVRVRYGGIEVLHGVRLAAAYGTFSVLVGPNGAGKTTLLDWCAGAGVGAGAGAGAGAGGEATAAGGWLRLDGSEATTRSAARRARAGLRYVPFERNVFPGLSVLDNLRAATSPAAAGTPEAVFALFPELERLAARPAGVLSGGERQLLAVACALFGPGRILLLDEPTHGLAPALADRVLAELARTARQDGRAVLAAEPSAERFAAQADFLWPLERGRRAVPATGA